MVERHILEELILFQGCWSVDFKDFYSPGPLSYIYIFSIETFFLSFATPSLLLEQEVLALGPVEAVVEVEAPKMLIALHKIPNFDPHPNPL